MRRLGLSVLLLLGVARVATAACTGAGLAWSSTNDPVSLQACVTNVTSGGTITVAAGSTTWTSGVSIPAGTSVSILGAGIGLSVITDASAAPPFTITPADGQFVRISGFTIDRNGQSHPGSDIGEINIIGSSAITSDAYDSVRIDHVDFARLAHGVTVHENAKFLSGLVDSSQFHCPTDTGCQSLSIYGATPGVSTHMGRAYAPGSHDAWYFEDNEVTYAYQGDGTVEAYGGAWFVMRRNRIHNGAQGSHGADSGNYRGPQAIETYQNTFDNAGKLQTSQMTVGTYRSGVILEWGDIRTGSGWTVTSKKYDLYRAREGFPTYGSCDVSFDAAAGSHPWDGNLGDQGHGEAEGYPCLDQFGWMFGTATAGYPHTLLGNYSWLNTLNGSAFNRAPVSSSAEEVRENREYYNETASFTGAAGLGVGLLASRPATCTLGVGYWATDQGAWDSTHAGSDGQLYKCTATNTWTLWYTPYTYPHPLRAAPTTPPDAPSGLSATTVDDQAIDLQWADTSTTEDAFLIERGSAVDCSDCQQITSVSAGTTVFHDTGLVASTTYRYRVRASNTSGASSYTGVASATTAATPAIVHVQDCDGTPATGSDTTITCTFAADVTGGTTMVGSVSWEGAGVTPTLSDTQSHAIAWAGAAGQIPATNIFVRAFLARNLSAGGTAITATFTGAATFRAIAASEFSGLGTFAVVAASQLGTTGTSTTPAASVTNVAADALLWTQFVSDRGSGPATVSAPYTVADAAQAWWGAASQVVTAVGPQTPTWTQGVSSAWAAQTLSIEQGTDPGGEPVPARTFYVDGSTGTDSAATTGAVDDPLRTIQYGLSRMVGCDTLVVQPGTYSGIWAVTPDLSGNADGNGCQTVIRSAVIGAAIIVGAGGNTGRIDIGLNNGAGSNSPTSYVRLDGFVFTQMNQCLFVYGGHDIVLAHNTCHAIGAEAIHVRGNHAEGNDAFNVTVEGNTVYDTGRQGGNGEGLYVGTGSGGPLDNSHDVILRGNTVYDTPDEGANIKPGTHAVLVEDNTFTNNGTRHVVCGSTGWGLDVEERDLGAQSWTGNPSHVVRRNTFTAQTCTAMGVGTGATVINNVIVGVTSGHDGIALLNNDGDTFARIVYHNTIDVPAAQAITTAGSPVVDSQNNIGPATSGTNLAASASFFVNPAAGNYQLLKGTAPINVGADLRSTVPIDRRSRARDVQPDIGAYEYSAGVRTLRLLLGGS